MGHRAGNYRIPSSPSFLCPAPGAGFHHPDGALHGGEGRLPLFFRIFFHTNLSRMQHAHADRLALALEFQVALF